MVCVRLGAPGQFAECFQCLLDPRIPGQGGGQPQNQPPQDQGYDVWNTPGAYNDETPF